MNVLVACECTGRVREAFRERGHDAWSNDIKPADDGSEFHIQGDCMDALSLKAWDLIVMHPPCTALSLSGNRWYGRGKERHQERLDAIKWTKELWEAATARCEHVALENPASVVFQHLCCDSVQYIQPWEFGHGEVKRTGFALLGLPHLNPTEIVEGREQRIWRMTPSADRQALRSETYPGIAAAIADQWGSHIQDQGDH